MPAVRARANARASCPGGGLPPRAARALGGARRRYSACSMRRRSRRRRVRCSCSARRASARRACSTSSPSAASADALVLRGRCLSYGEGITFWPIVEAIRRGAGIVDDATTLRARSAKLETLAGIAEAGVVDRVASMIGLGEPHIHCRGSVLGLPAAAREAVADAGPSLLLIEDLHWAEPTLHDFLETCDRRLRRRRPRSCAPRGPRCSSGVRSWRRATRHVSTGSAPEETAAMIESWLGGHG